MPQRQQEVPEEQSNFIAVPLFESGHEGYGDGRLVSSPHRYNRVNGSIDLRHPGELRMGDSYTTLAYSDSSLRSPPVWAGQARNAAASGAGRYPVLLFIADATLFQIQFGVCTSRKSLAQRASGATFHDNGSGVPRLVITEGDAGNIEILDLTTAGDTADSITGTIQRDKLASISGSLYGSAIPTGASRWNGVTFVPYGSNPAVAANWSAVTRVGWAMTDINAILGIRGVPCVVKPEGIFLYSRQFDLWENMMPSWEHEPDLNNGRGSFSLGPNGIIPLGVGGAVVFDGYAVRDFSPYSIAGTPNNDTTSQIISCLGTYRGQTIAATAVNHGYIGGAGSKEYHDLAGFSIFNQKELQVGTSASEGLQFWRTQDNEGSFSGTTNLGAGDLTTNVALGAQGTAGDGDYFYIGYYRPWIAVIFEFDEGAGESNTNTANIEAEYWDGSAWTTSGLTPLHDFTRGGVGGTKTLNQSGMIVMPQPAPGTWQTRSISTDAVPRYYIRFSVSATLSATVNLAAAKIIPLRSGADETDVPTDKIDRSGVYPHLLFGRDGGEERPTIWHDMGSPKVADEIGAIEVAPVGGAVGPTTKIVMLGRRQAYLFHVQDTDTWPWLDDFGFVEFAAFEPAGGRPVRLREVFFFGRDFDGVSQVTFYYRYAQTEKWNKEHLGNRPQFHSELRNTAFGTSFQYGIQIVMSQTEPIRRPVITGGEAIFEVLDADPRTVAQRPIQTPERG